MVLLPRADVILRPLPLPGVSNKDLDNAVRFQMDGLHPYGEDDVYSAWTRFPEAPPCLVAVVRRDAVERYAAPFEEAGVRVGAFTCSAAAVYSALRLCSAQTPAAELLAVDDSGGDARVLRRESHAPVVLRQLRAGNERAAALAAAELRIPSGTEPVPLVSLLGALPSKSAPQPPDAVLPTDAALPTDAGASHRRRDTHRLAAAFTNSSQSLRPRAFHGRRARHGRVATLEYIAAHRRRATHRRRVAVCRARCPPPVRTLCLSLNLLPAERRQAGSRLRWVPAVAFWNAVVLLLPARWPLFPAYENRKYLKSLEAQIAAATPRAERAAAIDKQVDALRRRIQLLDDLRRHPRADMDVMAELTRILASAHLAQSHADLRQAGDRGRRDARSRAAGAAAGCFHLFEASEFQAPPLRIPGGEQFRIKTNREGVR